MIRAVVVRYTHQLHIVPAHRQQDGKNKMNSIEFRCGFKSQSIHLKKCVLDDYVISLSI